jgi:hypothetical protein
MTSNPWNARSKYWLAGDRLAFRSLRISFIAWSSLASPNKARDVGCILICARLYHQGHKNHAFDSCELICEAPKISPVARHALPHVVDSPHAYSYAPSHPTIAAKPRPSQVSCLVWRRRGWGSEGQVQDVPLILWAAFLLAYIRFMRLWFGALRARDGGKTKQQTSALSKRRRLQNENPDFAPGLCVRFPANHEVAGAASFRGPRGTAGLRPRCFVETASGARLAVTGFG